MTIREIGVRFGFDLDKQSVSNAENAVTSLKNMATKALGAIGIGFGLTKLNAIAEEFNDINDKIAYATKGLGDQSTIQDSILNAANATKTSYGDMAGTVTKLVQLNKDLFPVDQAAEFATVVQKLLVTAGKSGSEASAVQSTLSRVFQTGKVNSGVLRSLFNTAPEVINTIADSLGVAKERLYDLADRGVLTGAKIKEALLSASEKIEEDYSQLDVSISDALLSVRNSWGSFVDEVNQDLHLTDTIAKMILKVSNMFISGAKKVKEFMMWLAEKLGGTENMLKAIGLAIAAMWAIFNADKIMKVIQTISSVLGAINLKVIAITAAVVLLILLIEDFIAFMQGKDSLIGELLKQAGVDVDETRDGIISAWTEIQEFLEGCWNGIKSAAVAVWDGLKKFWDKHGEDITRFFQKLWDVIVKIFEVAWQIIDKVVTAVGEALQAFWEKWGPTITKYLETAAEMWGTIFDGALTAILDILNIVGDIISGDWEGLWEDLHKTQKDITDSISTLVEQWWQGIQETFSEFWDAIKEDVEGAVNLIKKPIDDFIDWITGLPDQAYNWGKDLIQGWIDGLKGSEHGALRVVGDLAQGIADRIGFSEPKVGPLSKFHTFMPDMIKLMTDGLTANENKLRAAFANLAGDIQMMAQATMVNGGTAALAVPNNTVNKNVVQYNNFTNTFNGDRVAQAKSAEAMESASEDAIAYMARAMYYGG